MSLRSLKCFLVALFLPTVMTFACLAQTGTSDAYPGVQIEFPAGGQLRIENELGSVVIETWDRQYVYVTTNEAGSHRRSSSVTIENRSHGFVVRAVRRPGALNTPIDLNVKIPQSARLEITTTSGNVSVRGTPSSTTIKSIAGNINLGFFGLDDVDIVAGAAKGEVRSELPQSSDGGQHVFQARLGPGTRPVRINTDTGNITMSLLRANDNIAADNMQAPDPLDPGSTAKAAGIPAPALDAQEISEGDVIRVDSQLVTLNMSVIDRETNRGVVGLTQSDFKLFENGTEQKILQFDSSAAPFDLLLVIDLSGSTRDVLKLIRAAAQRFVTAARPSDRIGVITFAGQAAVVSPLTLDRQVLNQRISVMDTAAGDTKLYDAMDVAISRSLRDGRNARRTAIILMSDGLDGSIPGVQGDGSKLSYKDLLNRVAEFDGVVYTLWLNTEYEALSPLDTQPEAFDAGYDRMKEMADTGGGVFYEVERLEDLAGAYERVVADLGTVYSLAYRPSDKTRDGKWRAIRLNVVTRPSAIPRGKRGYYAN
ncbi:MAG TPA: VWA domain-containing protein [Pyrinomonadaceae bacterium]|nr:VWA domain-containing protein [Pyrinomonadaceae bacterium]